jgi:hypothetical protein
MKEKWKDFKDWFYYNDIFTHIIMIVIIIVLSFGTYKIFDIGFKKLEKENQRITKTITIDFDSLKPGTKTIIIK